MFLGIGNNNSGNSKRIFFVFAWILAILAISGGYYNYKK